MLYPSYKQLIDIVNKDVKEGEENIVDSRYSIIMAASKRARQISEEGEALINYTDSDKALSVAIKEIEQGKIKINKNAKYSSIIDIGTNE